MNTTPLESQVQEMVVQYLSILESQGKVLWFTGSGNGQYQKSIRTKMKMKREGIRAGMPDIFIAYPDRLVFIELKREKGWVASDDQKHAIEQINKACGHAYIAKWFAEAKKIIDDNIS